MSRAALKVHEQVPGFRLLAGTGTPSLTETIDLTRLAFELGFDAVVTLPPYYFRNATDEGLFNWFEQVITKSVPADGYLLGYHFPGVAGIGFSLELLSRLSTPSQRALPASRTPLTTRILRVRWARSSAATLQCLAARTPILHLLFGTMQQAA